MAAKTFKINKKVTNILSVILACLLAFGVILGFANMFGAENQAMKKISATVFSVGNVNAKGEYVKSDDAIYSDLIECRGLNIEQKFESESTYQVFYYNEDKVFIGRSDEFKNVNYEIEEKFDIAKFCRIVINPMQPTDDTETFKIYFWEVLGYANEFVIKVYATQNFAAPNYVTKAVNYDTGVHGADKKLALEKESVIKFLEFTVDSDFSFSINENCNVLAIHVINAGSIFIVDENNAVSNVMFFDGDKELVNTEDVTIKGEVLIPNNAVYCLIVYNNFNENSLSVKKYTIR